MQKRHLNFLVDAVGLLLFFSLVSTGVIMEFILPPGSSQGGSGRATLVGLDRHGWGDIHFWISVGFLAMVVLHLFLHWRWLWGIVGGTAATGPRRNRRGLVALGAVLALFAVMAGGPFLLKPERPDRGGTEDGRHRARGQTARAADRGRAAQSTSGTREVAAPSSEEVRARGGSVRIRGSMTLADVCEQTGVDLERLRAALKLPADVAADERLGHLRQAYGFEMSDLRAKVQELADKTP